MIRYIIVSLLNGVLFGVMDGIINANPFAQSLYKAYSSIAKTNINFIAGIIIDICYGFIIGFVFLLLYDALPGDRILKGITLGLVIWFFRVFMGVLSSWMMYTIPISTLLYTSIAGLMEMLILGISYGLFLKPFKL